MWKIRGKPTSRMIKNGSRTQQRGTKTWRPAPPEKTRKKKKGGVLYIWRLRMFRSLSYCWWFWNPVNSPVELGCLSHYCQGKKHHPRWCGISSINSTYTSMFIYNIMIFGTSTKAETISATLASQTLHSCSKNQLQEIPTYWAIPSSRTKKKDVASRCFFVSSGKGWYPWDGTLAV